MGSSNPNSNQLMTMESILWYRLEFESALN